jgi:hypothetical protein
MGCMIAQLNKMDLAAVCGRQSSGVEWRTGRGVRLYVRRNAGISRATCFGRIVFS